MYKKERALRLNVLTQELLPQVKLLPLIMIIYNNFQVIYTFKNVVSDVVWYKNDKLVQNTDNVKVSLLEKEQKTLLKIRRATMEDEAKYVCKATSEIGLAVTKATLKVKGESTYSLR